VSVKSTTHDHPIPHGRPSILHAVPQLYGGRDRLHHLDLERVNVCLEECVFKDFPCDEDVFHICVDLKSEYDLTLTNDVFETVNLYIELKRLISNELDVDS